MNEVEWELLRTLLDGDDPMLKALRQQVMVAQLQSRELSGVGFFLNFSVPDSERRVIPRKNFVIGDVAFDLDGLKYGGDAILFVNEGHISLLEGVLNADEKWPDQPKLKAVYYYDNPRNLDTLRKNWALQAPD